MAPLLLLLLPAIRAVIHDWELICLPSMSGVALVGANGIGQETRLLLLFAAVWDCNGLLAAAVL